MVADIQAIRGMNDILPEQSPYWQLVEATCRDLALRYHYKEIRFPMVEQTELFKRTIGEATDIVEKEMYTFTDRNGDSLTLRPEGTAGCVRAAIQNGLLHQSTQRLWYIGPMFRHERPQKGRYRQFHQFGLEAFGLHGSDIEIEHILFTHRLWEVLGLCDHLELQINTLGTSQARKAYRQHLLDYLQEHYSDLDEDSQRRFESNPLRILDSKNPDMQNLINKAPKLIDHIDDEALQHFESFKSLLEHLNIKYVINPRLVRGLDYYDYTVYEWVTTELGAQGTVCAGGRYNTLVEELGGKPTPAVGFALGLERTVLLLESLKQCQQQPDVFMVLFGDEAIAEGMKIAEQLRDELPNLKVEVNLTGGSFKSQFKRADKSGARFAIILGEDELAKQIVSIKDLRSEEPQQQMTLSEVILLLRQPKTNNQIVNC